MSLEAEPWGRLVAGQAPATQKLFVNHSLGPPCFPGQRQHPKAAPPGISEAGEVVVPGERGGSGREGSWVSEWGGPDVAMGERRGLLSVLATNLLFTFSRIIASH